MLLGAMAQANQKKSKKPKPAPQRKLPEMGADEFMIVVIPDSQVYTAAGSPQFNTLCLWIANHASDSDKNIQQVIHIGDITWYGTQAEYTNADAGIDLLDAGGVRYLVTTGNHDYDDDILDDTRDRDYFDARFPQGRFTGQADWSGGFYGGYADNAYWLRTIGGDDYLFMTLEWGPRDGALTWADGILTTYSSRDAFIFTHCYMYHDGTRLGTGDNWNPHDLGPGGYDCNDGDEIWTMLKTHDNIRLVASGHDRGADIPYKDRFCAARRQDDSDGGTLVNQWLFSPHFDGYIRLIAIRPTENVIDAYTYSPTLDRWDRDNANDFTVDYSA